MTKIDNSYMERLTEVLHDDKKMINYKGVSIMLGVHVNIAKQMLYHFYKTEKEKGKPIHATYYISGMLPRKMLSDFRDSSGEKEESQEGQSVSSISDELDAFLVLICRDRDLDRYKAKFTKIFSIHVYALSGFPLENFDPLDNLVEQPLRDKEGRTPVDFGPITCSAGQKFRENARVIPPVAPVPKEVSKVKEAVKKDSQTKAETEKSNSSKDEGEAQMAPKEKAKSVAPARNSKDRLKNMFASAASKPKTEKQKPEEKKDSSAKEANEKSSKSASASKGKEKNSDSRKRKRIRDVLSSDSEDEERKQASDSEEDSPESPLPKRMQIIESDSDDEFKEATPKKAVKKSSPEPEPVKAEPETTVSGRRRVSKLVSKSYLDADGFLVTSKEQVMVYEDEVEPSGTSSNNNNDSSKSKDNDPTVSEKASKPQSKRTEALLQSKMAKAAPSKTKQPSLMSFFQKK